VKSPIAFIGSHENSGAPLKPRVAPIGSHESSGALVEASSNSHDVDVNEFDHVERVRKQSVFMFGPSHVRLRLCCVHRSYIAKCYKEVSHQPSRRT
jgi:hypothetical protein